MEILKLGSRIKGSLRRAIGALLLADALCAGAATESQTVAPPAPSATGIASYYADKYHGKPTASGEIFDMHQLTAAHPKLRFGTIVKVTRLDNQRSVLVRINDRGPFIGGRVIDLSLAAAKELQMVRQGLAEVTLEIVK